MKNFLIKWLEKILADYARRVIAKSHVEIIGITGSVGKSSTKEAIFQVLNRSKKFRNKVKKSAGNLNNEIGLPLAILGINHSPRWWEWKIVLWQAFFRSHFAAFNPLKRTSLLVLEYAADKPGDIKYLTDIAQPKIGVITYVGEAHHQFFGSIDKIALEKAFILKKIPEDGLAVLNKDNEYVKRIGLVAKCPKIFFAIKESADIKAENIKISQKGTSFEVCIGSEKKQIYMPAIGKQQVYAALAAIAVGRHYNIGIDEITEALKDYHSPEGRDNIIKGINDTLIIDSAYNANPASMKAALETLKELKTSGRKIAILGDMKELGDITSKAHQDIGRFARQVADELITVGPLFKKTDSDKWFPDAKKAAGFIRDKVKKDDIILIKGSHAMKMEKIVDALSHKQ